jgi:hypothetical protein
MHFLILLFRCLSYLKHKPLDSYKQKLAHLRSLYHLARADKIITKAELIYIKIVADQLGIEVTELELTNGDEPELDLPDKEYKLYALFHRLVIILAVDEQVTDDEKRHCFNLGIKMGLHPNAIAEIIEYVTGQDPMNAMPEQIISIFRKYMS